MTAEARANEVVLEVRNLSKSFPGVKALENVRLEVREGTVHALMGENGAGKSTLVRILAGLHSPDTGDIRFEGRRVELKSPHHALTLGIAMIHQELLPFPDLTVGENIFMGHEPTAGFLSGLRGVGRTSPDRKPGAGSMAGHTPVPPDLPAAGRIEVGAPKGRRYLGWVDRRAMNQGASRLLERLGVALSPARKMRELSVAEMQTVEIAKAMAHRARILIMDEPTSALNHREVERLFEVIRELKRQGVAVIYISHKTDEVFRVADAVTVLRDGRHVASREVDNLTRDHLIALMVGRELQQVFPKVAVAKGEVALAVRGFTKRGRFRDVSFEVRRGEILGLAGLMGAGRTDLVNAIYGLTPAEAGEIQVHGRRARIGSPRDALAHGIAMVSEDRQRFGLVQPMSVKHNLTLSHLHHYCGRLLIDPQRENAVADELIRAYAIKARDRDEAVKFLSGGNQQKVVLAKALLTGPDVLILDEPTRGIDIAAKTEVYALLSRLVQRGMAVLLVSSELTEVLSISDRILVMRQGMMAAELDPRRTTLEQIMGYAMPA